ncbi:MAG: hypothetical protein J0H89_10055, partial [Rhizobiales bacterium]|nr:hypothetical protein [Hyphomicrobiales bacterium]
MPFTDGPTDSREQKLPEWFLLLLRFATTRNARNEAATCRLVSQFDSLGTGLKQGTSKFFRRMAEDICNAIADADDHGGTAILKAYPQRIDCPRLRMRFGSRPAL